jgi:hypothetical protein
LIVSLKLTQALLYTGSSLILLGFFRLDEAAELWVAQSCIWPNFSRQAPICAGCFAPATLENTGFSGLGKAYNARKGSTYTLAATRGCGLSVSGTGQIQGGVS